MYTVELDIKVERYHLPGAKFDRVRVTSSKKFYNERDPFLTTCTLRLLGVIEHDELTTLLCHVRAPTPWYEKRHVFVFRVHRSAESLDDIEPEPVT